MGYYDQDSEDRKQKQSRTRMNWVMTLVSGIALGALVVVFLIPTLSNLLPYNNNNDIAADEIAPVPEEKREMQQQLLRVNVSSDITDAVEKMAGSVVGVLNMQQTGFWSENGQAGTGSGVIYKTEGEYAYIVTNHHVIEGASSLEVNLKDDIRVPAELLGTDVYTDLAVIRIDNEYVDNVAEFGTSEYLKVGEPVIAIGNPLGLTFSGSVTQGIISGLNRTIEMDLNNDGRPDWQSEVVQTDAAINPGNSGGALVNIKGQLIGINSMKIARDAVEGIGLAIPIDFVIPIIEDLEEHGEVRRPYMGIGLRSLNEVTSYHWQETLKLPRDVDQGVFVVNVVPRSPAAQAGLEELDVIVELDGEPIHDVIDLRKHLYRERKIGDTMDITFYRQGKQQKTTMELTEDQSY